MWEKHNGPKRSGGTSEQGLNNSQNSCLEPKHKVFLSHSGAQKNFTAQLCEDLIEVNHFPFFDKRLDSLPKGEEFPPLIFKAARQCWVAILVLSEEFFTRSKWPMIELNEFVQAQAADNPGLKLLPLYFGLTLKQLKDANNQERWRATWERWANEDSRIDVGKWVEALSRVVGPINGMEYDGVDEVSFRKSVVESVCKLISPDVEYDVSHVQARGRFCKAIQQKLEEEVDPYGVYGHQVMGLFGMPGMGKSTISKAMCNENFGEFVGKVCHVEFHGSNHVELRKKVLREMTGLKQDHLPDEGDKLLYLLKSRMQQQKVFLIFDNVLSQEDIDEAKMYLDIGYLDGSRLLVTSRSLDILKSVGVQDSDCMEMLELEEQDAKNAFFHYAHCRRVSFNQAESVIIKRCVEACKFKRSELGGSECGSSEQKYLLLALKVWGTQLGEISNDPLSWVEDLQTLDEHKFNPLNELEHPLFRVLRQGYDKLVQMDQRIFLDLAIFYPRHNNFDVMDYNIVVWLSIIYGCSKSSINRSLRAIQRKGLLEPSGKGCLAFKIHDLYVEFVRLEAQAGAFEGRRILYEVNGTDIPRELLRRPACGIWPGLERLGLHKSQVKSMINGTLDCTPNVKILQLYDCHELVEVDVGGMKRLMSLDIVGCERLLDKFWGVWMLENLVWFRWSDIDEQRAPFSLDFSGLTSIQVLYLSCVLWRHKSIDPPDLNGCIELRELTMSGFHSLESFPDLSKLFKLEKVYFRYGRDAKSVSSLSSLRKLKILSLYWCPEVTELPGLGVLVALETLELVDVGLSKIYGLAKLRHLQILIVSDCRYLSSLDGLEYVKSLRVLDASGCKKLREVPNTSNLRKLKVVNLSHSGVCTLPSNFEWLAKHDILKIEGCVGLFEPLVVWLLDQEQYQSGGCPESMAKQDLHHSCGNILETRFGSPTLAMPTLVSPTSLIALPKKSTFAMSHKLFAHYMDEVVLFRVDSSINSLINLMFFEEEILCGACILEAIDGGIEIVISTLCKCNDMGMLSLVVAKYASRGCYWDLLTKSKTIQPLCARIMRFLEEVYNEMEADMKIKGQAHEHLMSLVQFILGHLTKNEKMAQALEILKISTLIQCFVDKFCLRGSSLSKKKLLDILELCKLQYQKVQIINSRISTNLLGWNKTRGEGTYQRLVALEGEVVGLFGTIGMGKTTLSKAICKAYFAKFDGIVCHIEFNGESHLELRRKLLGELNRFDQIDLFINDYEVNTRLNNCLNNQKVFLCLDNVQTKEDIEEAKMYLNKCYLLGSKVLVTSQSLNVLTQSLRLKESDCIEMPELEEQDAINVFLHYTGCAHKSFNKMEVDAIERHVEICMFTKSELDGTICGSRERKYLPLALKAWGTHLRDIGDNPLGWDQELKTLDKQKLNASNDPKHLLFCVLRQAYDKLDHRDQCIFLDLALFIPWDSFVNLKDHNIVRWLCIIYECSKKNIKCSLEAMRRKGLLENSEKDIMGFKIHNLYIEFARVEAQFVPFHKRRICQKRYLVDMEWYFIYWSNLKVLQLYDCDGLEEFNVGSMKSLMSLDIIGCRMLGENFQGIDKLRMLAWFRWEDNAELSPLSLLHLFGLSSLQAIFLEIDCSQMDVQNLMKCTKLCELTIKEKSHDSLHKIPSFENLLKLGRPCFGYVLPMDISSNLCSLTSLKVLSLYRCSQVTGILELAGLIALETLELIHVGLFEINGLVELRCLRTLIVSSCENLDNLDELDYVPSLRVVDVSECKALHGMCNFINLVELKVLRLYRCPQVYYLNELYGLIALETLTLVHMGLSMIHDLAKLRCLRTLIVSNCDYLYTLHGLECLTSLRVVDASGCKALWTVPDCSNLAELEVVNLSHSGVCILSKCFERLAKHGILKIEGCDGLIYEYNGVASALWMPWLPK